MGTMEPDGTDCRSPSVIRPDVVRLNLADNREVDVLCASFGCARVDVYIAVATVGDVLNDVRRYLAKAIQPRAAQTVASLALHVLRGDLPASPSIPESSGNPRRQLH
ncbi:MAG: DUF3606 domain-containing protein [Betaproteobacteria bacterium]